MGYAEFPHINYDETDFRELIQMVRECRNNYKGTLDSITALNNRLDAYEKDVNSRLDDKVKQSMNTFQGIVLNAIDSDFAKMNQNLSTQIAQIQSQLTKWESDQEEKYSQFTINIINTIDSIEDNNNIFKAQIRTVLKEFSTSFTETTESLNSELELYKQEVENTLNSFKQSLPLNIESILWLWNYAVDSRSYNALEWYNDITTCEQWNESKITAAQWHTNSKEIFNWYSKREKLISPVSGDIVSPQRAIIELAEKLKINAINAAEYDALKLTAIDFDELFMKAGDYDWLGNLLLDKSSTVEQKGE